MYLPGSDVYSLRGRTLLVTAAGGIGYAPLYAGQGGIGYASACPGGMGCVDCYGLCPMHKEENGMGQLEFLGGAGSMVALAGAGLLLYGLLGSPAKERRRQLRETRARHKRELAEIRGKYGRFRTA